MCICNVNIIHRMLNEKILSFEFLNQIVLLKIAATFTPFTFFIVFMKS